MAYQEKYYFEFVSIDGKANRVEIWEDTGATITAVEVKSMAMPFSVSMPDLDGKFQVVRGSGCEINLLSETNMQFFTSLYAVNKKAFMVKHYIDTVINWVGYLNTEMNREPYITLTNYPVQFSGNDGFALMDRYQFLQGVSDPVPGGIYEGIKSKWDILNIILTRIGLPYGYIYTSLSTTFTGYLTVFPTLLHQSYVNCSNFYDEDGVAMTMREVLEAILQPYGAFITQLGADIYITDLNTLALGTDVTWMKIPFIFTPVTDLGGVVTNESTSAIARWDIVDFGSWTQATATITINGYTNTIAYNYSVIESIEAFIIDYGASFGAVTLVQTADESITFYANVPGTDFIGASSVNEGLFVATGQINVLGIKVYRITLSGSSGTANVTCNGFTHLMTFDTSLTLTAQNFAADYLNSYGDLLLEASSNAIIFTLDDWTANFVGETLIVNTESSGEEVIIDPLKTITGIEYAQTGGDIEISGGKNKQTVKYSPYPSKYLIDPCLSSAEEFGTIPTSYTTVDNDVFKVLEDHDTFLEYTPAEFQYGKINGIAPEFRYYLKWPYCATPQKVADLKISPQFVINGAIDNTIVAFHRILNGVGIMIKGKVYFENSGADFITQIYLNIKVSIGSKTADNYFTGWLSGSNDYNVMAQSADATTGLQRKWSDLNPGDKFYWTIPCNIDLSGDLIVEIYSNVRVQLNGAGALVSNPSYISDIRLSDFSVDIIDLGSLGALPKSDIEFVGYLDEQYKEEGDKVELKCGSDTTFTDRGKIMYAHDGFYTPIQTWIRGGQTYKIEQLLLNSLVSNSQTGFYTLSNLKLRNAFNQLNVIQDTYTGDKVFMVKSMSINFRDDQIDTTLVEITPDELTITT
jgi:hypothetical protein